MEITLMYDSLILRTVARLMLPILIVLSVFMLLRGHNEPGGGFIGGLLAASAIILRVVAEGPKAALDLLPVNYLTLGATGVFLSATGGLIGLLFGKPFLKGLWFAQEIPGVGKIGTPLLFDIGVYLTVVGITVHIALMLAEEPELYPIEEQPLVHDKKL
jgi:multicomponent Na+:H+ antiporter subunit B